MYNYILVVDDDIILAYAIQSYLSSKAKKIFIVDNSIIAIKLLNLYKFDLVISDIIMPNYSGYDLLLYLRLYSHFSSIPFIFLSAKGFTADRIKGYNLGCSIYLTKPFHPSELLSIVNNILLSVVSFNRNKSLSTSNTNCTSSVYLTSREYSVLKLLVKGWTNKEIAATLNLNAANI
jgi:DNA-binding NarL/FixJ family response regulator